MGREEEVARKALKKKEEATKGEGEQRKQDFGSSVINRDGNKKKEGWHARVCVCP